ncbi:MAG: hypothetical protein KH231_06275 [Dialister sp.]|uniref:hypothetical protein n=1 Tax=Dialister sp. TaxID=1955814 RepID=UPI001D7F521A|nr:hypothetical protein [Dialister sp.]MBS6715063.1 hypothetical protein [Dialister sp.]
MGTHLMDIYVWVNQNNEIKKAKTNETLLVNDEERLCYCPVCGKRFSHSSTNLNNRTCICCHQQSVPYITKHTAQYYLEELDGLRVKLNEPHLNIDDLIIEEELLYLDSFQGGITYNLIDHYCAVYCGNDLKLASRDTVSKYDSEESNKSAACSFDSTNNRVDDSIKKMCPMCYSENIIVSGHLTPILFNEATKYTCLNCYYQFREYEINSLNRRVKEGIE